MKKETQELFYSVYESPIGAITVACCEEGVKETGFWDCREEGVTLRENEYTQKTVQELKEYFEGKRKEFTVPCLGEGTEFQKRVWAELKKIPYGETRTYKEIAEAIGNPRACRAVGMANNKNPIGILVPCHRVVGADGSLTGYAGGLDKKEQLLELEQKHRLK